MSVYGGPEINDSGLVLYLDAANPRSYSGTGTTWTDLIDQANNGTLINGVGFNSINGGSLTFNGSNQRVSTNFKPSGARSYFIWVKYNTINSLPNGFSLTGTQQVNAYNYLGIYNGGYFYYYAGTTGNQLSSVLLNANTWYQQGFVLNADGSRTLYLNGLAVGSEAGGVGGTATSEFSIGCVNQNHWVNGSIPVVTQYNRALTSSEVLQNYNATRDRFATPAEVKAGLILDLDAGNTSSYSGSGTTWTDLSGSGYNATLYNGPTFNSGNGGSIVFDGSNDYAQTANLTSVVSEKTLAAWCQLGSTTQSGGGLIGVMSTDGSIFDTIVYNETGQGWGFGSNNFFRTAWSGVSESSTSAWVYLAATYSNNLYKLYRNGVLILTTTAYSLYTFNIGINFIVGKRHSTVTGPLNAKIAKATVYNRALSALEIGTNFDALRGRYGL